MDKTIHLEQVFEEIPLQPPPGVIEIRKREELNGQGASKMGLLKGLQADIAALPLVMRIMVRDGLEKVSGSPQPKKPTDIITVPGFAAGNWHLANLRRHMPNAGDHRLFDTAIRNRTILEDAEALAADISYQQAQIGIVAHSRGGLVALCMLRMLEEQGLARLIRNMVLLSPTSHGIREEIARIARHIPLKVIQDLCPNSEPVNFWQELQTDGRSKVTVISQEGGDLFTSPENSFVDGGRMLITPHCGHQHSVINPNTSFFQTVVKTAKA